jgi:hypothetical protein
MGARWTQGWWLAGALIAMGCAAGSLGEDAGRQGDAGRRDGSVPRDGGRTDGGPRDGGNPCGDVTCMPFQFCEAGRCRDYPACGGDGSCPNETDVCHNRRCVPGNVDVDGDGSPAASDCDETNAQRSPLLPEICGALDDDCDGNVDEGDPAVLCESNPGGGICIEGSCGCPAGTYDLDRTVPGCECVAAPSLDQGTACGSAIDLGDLADTGQSQRVSGNAMPPGRDIWYRFRGVDAPDSACDNYHVRVLFLENPGDAFELTVFRGSCDMAACSDMGFTDYNWATDFRQTIGGRLTGECPCYAAGTAPRADVSLCTDDTTSYFVRVRRRAGAAVGCQSYSIELSNGLYDTM